LESISESQSRPARRRPSAFQLFKYAVFAIVLVNLCFYFAEDVTAFLYLDASAPFSDILETFAVTIDYSAWMVLVVLLVLPTNLMVILGGIQAVENKVESIFLTADEFQGLMWIESNTESDSVILASPDMGLFIPAYTGRRVWYGHPFETPHAERVEAALVERVGTDVRESRFLRERRRP